LKQYNLLKVQSYYFFFKNIWDEKKIPSQNFFNLCYIVHGQVLCSDKVIPCPKYPDKFNLLPYRDEVQPRPNVHKTCPCEV